MITGDNLLTAAAIAAEAGVDDFIAEATPEKKLAYIRRSRPTAGWCHVRGRRATDAPALAQADVGLATNEGTQAAKEAGNRWSDSNPAKLLLTWCWWGKHAGDPWRPDHLLHRQRRGRHLRHPAGPVHRRLSAAGVLNLMQLGSPGKRHPVGHHLPTP